MIDADEPDVALAKGESELPDIVAAVDLGSNSFHLKLARVIDGELQVIDRLREMVRLAAGLDASNRLHEDTVNRALECLKRFGQRLRDIPSSDVRVVGTNTLRRARNAPEFLSDAQDAIGHPIEVIAGREEARLIYLGVSHSAKPSEAQRLVVDIGGGSTELIIGRARTPLNVESLYMGCVSYSREHFGDGKIRRRGFKRAELAAAQELEPIEAEYKRVGWELSIGASGTIRAAEEIARLQGIVDSGLTLEALRWLREQMIEAGDVSALEFLNGQRERGPVFPGGIAILIAVFEALEIKRMEISDGALREGVLYDLLGRLADEDIRENTIKNLATRFRLDIRQGDRVAQTAAYFYNQVRDSWKLKNQHYGDCLMWAARLHELGLDIAHSQYQKHGAYILKNADLPGFSRQEQELVALLVRAHRRKFPADELSSIGPKLVERTCGLATLLRLAVLLHRGRSDLTLPGIVADAGPRVLRLAFPPGWLSSHPLTEFELEQEVSFLKHASIKLSFS